MAHYPNWVTPERQAELADLFRVYGNRCLYGHRVCPDITHYIRLQPKTVYVSKPLALPIIDADGLVKKDADGKPMYLTIYKGVKSTEVEAIPLRLYDVVSLNRIADYKAEDKANWQAERKQLHSLAEPREYRRGEFNAIGRDIFYGNQPLFYREMIGISATTMRPLVKVRIASSYMRLYIDVDLTDILKSVSKNAKRKAIRYGRKLRQQTENEIDKACSLAVKHYLNS